MVICYKVPKMSQNMKLICSINYFPKGVTCLLSFVTSFSVLLNSSNNNNDNTILTRKSQKSNLSDLYYSLLQR